MFCKFKRKHLPKKVKCFYFTSKVFFILVIIKFYLFRYSNVMTLSSAWNKKPILLDSLECKHNLVMKIGQFRQYYKKKVVIKKFCEKLGLKSSSKSFLIVNTSSVKRNLRSYVWWFWEVYTFCYEISNMNRELQKFQFSIEFVLNS